MSGNVTARMKLCCRRGTSIFLKRQQHDVTDLLSQALQLTNLHYRDFERYLLT